MRNALCLALLAAATVSTACRGTPGNEAPLGSATPDATVALPPGGGIGFDDLFFDPVSGRMVSPAPGTGFVDQVDVLTRVVTSDAESGAESITSDGSWLYA